MWSLSKPLLSASARIQDIDYLYASDSDVSSFVSVKLSGNRNYLLWKVQMIRLLGTNNSINMCGIMSSALAGTQLISNKETMRQYSHHIRGYIFGFVTEDVAGEVLNLGSGKAVWEKLKPIYDPTLCLQLGIVFLVNPKPQQIIQYKYITYLLIFLTCQ
ncbi:hypothetical protein Hanom_Chr14g01305281 [Helianthus anomalus]